MVEPIIIPAPKLVTLGFRITGTAPYVQHAFGAKARKEMLETQMAGSTAKSKKVRKPREPAEDYMEAMHVDEKGRHGIPAPAFRAAAISACKLVGFHMTKAKLSIFIEADCFDVSDGTPLVLIEGEPEMHEGAVRLATGVASIAIRPMWRKWAANLRVKFDADQFRSEDIYNLLIRAGVQVGIGEGRPDSKKSHGMGWGTFGVEPIL